MIIRALLISLLFVQRYKYQVVKITATIGKGDCTYWKGDLDFLIKNRRLNPVTFPILRNALIPVHSIQRNLDSLINSVRREVDTYSYSIELLERVCILDIHRITCYKLIIH